MTANDPQQPNPMALRCPSCGAALPDGGSRVECSFCGTMVDLNRQRKAQQQQPQQQQPQQGGAVWKSPTITVVQTRRKAASAGGGCALGVILLTTIVPLAIVGAILTFTGALSNIFGAGAPTLPAGLRAMTISGTQAAVALPLDDAADGALPQLAALVRDSTDSKYHLALLSMADRKVEWLGPALSDQALSYAAFASTPDLILFADERTLVAHSRADGTERWTNQLSDRICDTCMVVAGDVALTLSIDSRVAAIDLASGETLWTRDLPSSNSGELQIFDGKLVLFSYNEDSVGEVQLVDVATGETDSSFVPSCDSPTFPGNTIDAMPSGPRWFDLEQGLALFVSYSSDTCIHAYDLATGEQRWASFPEDSSYSLTNDTHMLRTGDELLIGAREQIVAVDLQTGELRDLLIEEDHQLIPLMVRDGTLAAIAIRERGTRRAELWGIDMGSGKRRWLKSFEGDGQMIGPPFEAAGVVDKSKPIWTWAELPQGLALLTLSSEPQRYTISTVDLQTGQATPGATIDRPTGSSDTVWVPDIVVRRGPLLLLEQTSDLIGIDLAQGKVVYEGP